MGMRLFEISHDYRAVLDRVDDAEGVLDGTLEADLDAIVGAFEEKVDACAVVLRELDAEAEAIKAEEQRLARRRKAIEANAARLTAYVGRCLAMAGTRKVAGTRAVVSLRSNESVVVGCDVTELPAQFVRTKTVQEPDRVGLRAALKSGAEIPGVALVTSDSVVIR